MQEHTVLGLSRGTSKARTRVVEGQNAIKQDDVSAGDVNPLRADSSIVDEAVLQHSPDPALVRRKHPPHLRSFCFPRNAPESCFVGQRESDGQGSGARGLLWVTVPPECWASLCQALVPQLCKPLLFTP